MQAIHGQPKGSGQDGVYQSRSTNFRIALLSPISSTATTTTTTTTTLRSKCQPISTTHTSNSDTLHVGSRVIPQLTGVGFLRCRAIERTPDRRSFFVQRDCFTGSSPLGSEWDWKGSETDRRQGECIIGMWTVQKGTFGM